MRLVNQKHGIIVILIIVIIMMIIFYVYEDTKSHPKSNEVFTTMKLPEPIYNSNISIEEAIKERRSIREYKNEDISLQQISQLLWAAQGVTSPNGYRTAPSAGALYPLEIYLVSGRITNLAIGIYHYLPNEHALEFLTDVDVRNQLAKAGFEQNDIKLAAADIVITADYTRTTTKYGQQGERFVHMEAGHAAQNILLQVKSLGLGTVPIGAFNDSEVKNILHLPDEVEPLYILPIGKI